MNFPIKLQQRELTSPDLGRRIDASAATETKIECSLLGLTKARIVVIGRLPILDFNVVARETTKQALGDPLTSVLRRDVARREIQRQEKENAYSFEPAHVFLPNLGKSSCTLYSPLKERQAGFFDARF